MCFASNIIGRKLPHWLREFELSLPVNDMQYSNWSVALMRKVQNKCFGEVFLYSIYLFFPFTFQGDDSQYQSLNHCSANHSNPNTLFTLVYVHRRHFQKDTFQKNTAETDAFDRMYI